MEVALYRIVSVTQMRALENEADQRGLPYAQMMHNAGVGMALQIFQKFNPTGPIRILGLVGSGNNGGDTLVALTALQNKGWETNAYIVKERDPLETLAVAYKKSGGEIYTYQQDLDFQTLDTLLGRTDVVLDGILGTGISLPVRGEVQQVLQQVKGMETLPYVIAVDCPSGIDCDTGAVDEFTLPANWTICMAAVKQGMLVFPAFEYIGELSLVDIGLDENNEAWGNIQNYCIEKDAVREIIPERALRSHKGTFGTALIFAGSRNYPGAAFLAGRAAYAIGTGLVQMATSKSVRNAIACALPEVTWKRMRAHKEGTDWGEEKSLANACQKASAILAGPGWGQGERTSTFLKELLETMKKDKSSAVVLDADGLNLLSTMPEMLSYLPPNTVLTPHPGEMSRLTGLSIAAIQADRVEMARKYAQQWGAVVVLKGALTVIAHPQGAAAVIPVATPALAKAGSGDVLAGMIVGLLAQGEDAFDAACAGAWLHAQAGLRAARNQGNTLTVIARDIIASVPAVLQDIK